MADTEFVDLPTTNVIASTDQILLVRNGAAYRFAGTLPALDANGALTLPPTPNSTITGTFTVVDAAWRLVTSSGVAGGAGGTSKAKLALLFNGVNENAAIDFQRGGDGVQGSLAFRTNNAERVVIDPGGVVRPGADNTQPLGLASFRWSTVYAGSPAINTSDERAKQQIQAIPDEWLDAWADVEWCRFRFNDAVQEKGDRARWHLGLIAQRVRDAFEARDLDGLEIGLLCFDRWDAVAEVPAVAEQRDEAGAITVEATPAVPARAAGDRWGLRYDECQAIEAAWQRREIERLRMRLAAIEKA